MVRQLLIRSSRAPFRRAGLVFASVRDPLTIDEFDLTGEQLLRVLTDPVLSVATRADAEADWEPVPTLGAASKLTIDDMTALAQAHDHRRAEYLNTKALEGDAGKPEGEPASAGITDTNVDLSAGATREADDQSTGSSDAKGGADLPDGGVPSADPQQSEGEQVPPPIVEPQAPAPDRPKKTRRGAAQAK